MSNTDGTCGPDSPIARLLIVGGGTAGWMTAAALARVLQPAIRAGQTRIELVESADIGTVGVGEATVPTIRPFNAILGLDEIAFMRATNATFKLGIEFAGWRADTRAFFHGFGDYATNSGPYSTLNHWLYLTAHGDEVGDFDTCSPSAMMARHNRFAAPVNDPRSPLGHVNYAFHFDAALYAALLRQRAEGDGVIRHEGRITTVTRHAESGDIDAVHLSDGRIIGADMFIDCSGFVALLSDGVLKVPFLDYGHWLPVDRAWAVPSASPAGPLTPYTRATAREAGWQWRIPLQKRMGNGYVFSSAHLSEDEARMRLLGALDGKALAEPRRLKFRTGRRQSFWEHNCVSIGLSSGFIEPLESTSIQLIQNGITRLIDLMPGATATPALRREYNRLQAQEFDQVRDFIIAHYALSGRGDTPFWRDVTSMSLPDELTQKLETFRDTGVLPLSDQESFALPSWQAVLIGLGHRPRRAGPLLAVQDPATIRRALGQWQQSIAQTVNALPDHAAFLKQYRLME